MRGYQVYEWSIVNDMQSRDCNQVVFNYASFYRCEKYVTISKNGNLKLLFSLFTSVFPLGARMEKSLNESTTNDISREIN